jgi:hypothetical protein
MTQKVQIRLLSDLALANDADSQEQADVTRRFSVDGADFEIDLSHAESETLDQAMAPYREAARLLGRSGKTRGQGRGTRAVDAVKVRIWARENGYDVKDRGKVPAHLVAKYEAAQGS